MKESFLANLSEDLLSLRALLGSRMNSPPASLAWNYQNQFWLVWFVLVEKRFACIRYQNTSHIYSNVLFLKECSCGSNQDDFCNSRHTHVVIYGKLVDLRPWVKIPMKKRQKHILTQVLGSNHPETWVKYIPGLVEPWTKLGPARMKKKAKLSWTKNSDNWVLLKHQKLYFTSTVDKPARLRFVKVNQNNYKYWDGNAVFRSSPLKTHRC